MTRPPHGALLVAGTTSDAGKTTVVAALCRWLRRQGVRVAPFKAQNMSNNSVVTVEGGEIGRAQAFQAAACGLAPSVRFNPVLLKPGSDATSQVVVLGRPVGSTGALDFQQVRAGLAETVTSTLAGLRADYDVVVCEGAGSPAEINLRAGDLANMGLARAAGLPTLLVGDIDRGGMLAALHGTLALLSPADQALVAGFVVNKFRGSIELLKPGLDMLTDLTGRPVHGVLPYLTEPWLDAEDSVGYTDGRLLGRPGPPRGTQALRVAVVRLPRLSNATDVEALAAEPGVRVRLTTSPDELAEADLVVLPGTRATVADLAWLRATGLADAIGAHAAAGRPVLGLCGGYQMLGETIDDEVESGHGRVAGLGLLPLAVTFAPDKTLRRPTGTALGAPVGGYEIHHGVASVRYGPAGAGDSGAAEPLLTDVDGVAEGCRLGSIFGTHWHGAFEHDEFRRRFLTEVAGLVGRHGFAVAPDTRFGMLREKVLDRLADMVEDHLDTAAVLDLINAGAPPGLPVIPPAGPPTAHRPPDPVTEPAGPPAPVVVPTDSSAPVVVPTDSSVPVVVPTDSSVPGAVPTDSSPPGALPRQVDLLVADELRPLIEQGAGAGAAERLGPPAPLRPESFVPGERVPGGYAELADTVLAAAPSLGRVRLVAVDGRAGSGKSTFTARLRAALAARDADVTVLRTDDLLQGWLDTVTFWPRLEEWVLAPLRRDEPAAFRRFDWDAGRFPDRWEPLGRPGVLILDGVSSARAIARPECALSVYVQVERERRFERGVRRDGVGVVPDFSRWMLDEDVHFAADDTARRVDLLIDGDPPEEIATEARYVRIIPPAAPDQGSP